MRYAHLLTGSVGLEIRARFVNDYGPEAARSYPYPLKPRVSVSSLVAGLPRY